MTLAISSETHAAARRALMAGDSEYFSWSPAAQERFRATASIEVRNRVDQVLLKQVLGIECAAANARKVWGDLSIQQLNDINPASLLTQGIGEDYIFLNESLSEGTSLLDFKTLYDYDYHDFLFQEEWRHRDLESYISPGYFPLQHPCWIRLLINNELVYGNLHSLAGYVMDQAAENGDRRLNELIPSSLVQGPDHGKSVSGGVQWDYRPDAGGWEPQLKELQRRWWQYQQDAQLSLQQQLAGFSPAAYIMHDETLVPGESNISFVIRNEKTMHRICWRTFLSDVQKHHGDIQEVEALISRETDKACDFIMQQCDDILRNFVPLDIQPDKDRKVVVSDAALESLMRLDPEPPENE